MGGELSIDLHDAFKEFTNGDPHQGLFLLTEAFTKSFSREQRRVKERKKQAENAQDHHQPSFKNVDSTDAESGGNIESSSSSTASEDDDEFELESGNEGPDASGETSREAVANFGSQVIPPRPRGKGLMTSRGLVTHAGELIRRPQMTDKEKRKARKKRQREAEKVVQ